tara:strand:+ start:376 stop:1389 length:1014 start_codon:yes stop_codon:yes gene_type:complete
MIANFLLDSRRGGPHFVLESIKKKTKNFKKKDFYLDKKNKNIFFSNFKKFNKFFFIIDTIINSLIIFYRFKKYKFFFIYGVYNLAPILGGLLSNKKMHWFILEDPNFLGKITLKIFYYLFNIQLIFISKNTPITLKIKNYQIFIPDIDLNFWKNKKIQTKKVFTMTCVGNLNKGKNYLTLLKFLEKINFKFTLNIVGQKLLTQLSYYNKLKKQVIFFNKKYSSKIILHGRKDNNQVRKILNSTDIFILPSITEGLSISLLEAMAMKCICLVSQNSNHSSIVNKKNGFIFNLEANSFVKEINKIKKLNTNQIEKIVSNAKFDVKKLQKKYSQFLFYSA